MEKTNDKNLKIRQPRKQGEKEGKSTIYGILTMSWFVSAVNKYKRKK